MISLTGRVIIQSTLRPIEIKQGYGSNIILKQGDAAIMVEYDKLAKLVDCCTLCKQEEEKAQQ